MEGYFKSFCRNSYSEVERRNLYSEVERITLDNSFQTPNLEIIMPNQLQTPEEKVKPTKMKPKAI